LQRSLPEHMVPAAFVALDALPLSPNGKLDRRALPAPDFAAPVDTYVAPRTPVEEALADIWAQVLGVARVGIRDDFFALGGHSLLATRLVWRIREALAGDVDLVSLFESPTIEAIAPRLSPLGAPGAAAAGDASAQHLLATLEDLSDDELDRLLGATADDAVPARTEPAAFAQERLWFLDRMNGTRALYNVPEAQRLTGALDVPALERALGEIVRRHEPLRTTLAEAEGAPVQVIAPFSGFSLPVDDLSALPPEAREAEVRRRVDEDARQPFDLAAGPLFRAALLRLGEREHVLLLCTHHVATDAWSMGVLFRELQALYAAFRAGAAPALAPLPVRYADYAAWQREQLRGAALERQVGWWRERLAGAPARLELPTDRPRPAAQSFRGAREDFDLPAGLLDGLRALGRSEGATLYMVVLAAFQLLLARYAGTDDVVVGSAIAGRTRPEVEGLIGFFVNTLALRTDLSGDPTFRGLLRRVREVTLGAYQHQEVPIERLVEELAPGRSLGHSPLFQVMLVHEDADLAAASLAGVELRRLPADTGTSKFDLTLGFGAGADGIDGSVEYATDLFDRATIERMIGQLRCVLEQVSADGDLRLSAVELTGEAERRQVLEAWNATDAVYPADATLHGLFEAQVIESPDAVAVVFEDESLTYAELNARANRLAHHLRTLGVGPEVRVGLCLERSLEMVVALLGVLKAGGAYVPLDPGYPAERIETMAADSGVAVLLTQDRLTGVLSTIAVPTIRVDADWETIAAASAENPRSGVTARNLAYVIYTSGSTGRPKGVMNAHGGVVNRLCWMQAEYGIGAGDVVLQKTPFSFDVSVWELFWPLQQGATLVMAKPGGHRDPLYLQEEIERRGVTTLHFVPSMLQPFVETADPA
ncbi:MAG TPA: condensation domain-containing protein, partial [Longimicrobium sp.]|nr:condensation domain-containing protein [Longimicrobium sp.]